MPSDEVIELRRELGELKSRLALLERLLLEDEPSTNGRYPKAAPPTWHDLEVWVGTWMSDVLERRASNTRRWCAQWWEHPEVVTRFWALYHSWREVTSQEDALTYSQWFVDHLDRHLEAIFSADGPFAACSPERHTPHSGLTVGTVPEAAKKQTPPATPVRVAVPPEQPAPMEVKR